MASGLPGKAWTDADLRGGAPPFLAGDGCNGGTVSTLEELLIDGVVDTVISVDFTSLVDGCLQGRQTEIVEYANLVSQMCIMHVYVRM